MISHLEYLQFSPYFAGKDFENQKTRLGFLSSFDSFSEEIRNILTSFEIAEKIKSLGSSFQFDDFDTEILAFAIRKIIIGEVTSDKTLNLLTTELPISQESAQNLLNSINQDILQKKGSPRPASLKTSISQTPKPSSSINQNNIVDLRNRQN